MTLRIAIFVSGKHGRGSNLQSIVDGCRNGVIDGEVVLVVGNYAESQALYRARGLEIRTEMIPSPRVDTTDIAEEEYGRKLVEALESVDANLICLCGYIRKLPEELVRLFDGRIMNIHNGLLPSFGGKGMYGMRVHEAVVDSGVRYSGCTVHFVDNGYDTGPIILQAVVPVEQEDTPQQVADRVLVEEHRIYPQAVALFAQGRLKIDGRRVRILPELISQAAGARNGSLAPADA